MKVTIDTSCDTMEVALAVVRAAFGVTSEQAPRHDQEAEPRNDEVATEAPATGKLTDRESTEKRSTAKETTKRQPTRPPGRAVRPRPVHHG